MKIHRFTIAVGLAFAFVFLFESEAQAQDFRDSTKIWLDQPTRIPGRVLPPGAYVFQQGKADDNPDIVEIFNSDGTVLLATLFTLPADRTGTTRSPSITLADVGAGNPQVLVKWFYRGDSTGHEFVYSTQLEKEISQAKQRTLMGDQLKPNGQGTSR